ncbi:S-layer protein [Paenibacillus selenitireducens]|uniref:S-layer protein n=2 Tax=Paenibacillus selenitireducens TaxID=1324314 RepID=A0A1T2X3B8_9BACL|nr:S-layer protein [Paenibacillus selenitireducens]
MSFFGSAIPMASVSAKATEVPTQSPRSNATGQWMSGEFHVHTFESDDAQISLEDALDHAFDTYGFDWIATANHLRSSKRDDTGADIPGGPIPFSKGAMEYEVPKIKQLQAQGKYAGKTIFSGFEWDMPSHEHVSVGILGNEPNSEATLKAANQFEYLFTNRDKTWFDPADVAVWDQQGKRAYTTHADALTAVQWLKDRYAETSYMILNHPSRIVGKYTIADIRDLNNAAPDIVFGMEGMIGGQMEPDRGGYNTAYNTANPTENTNYKNRSYGGTDYMVAKVGGVWDALLGDGRRFWNFANSDFHFKIRGPYSSGYWPGEYSKNYTWTEGRDMQSILNGMRSGKSFSVYGDLINALDFNVASNGVKEDMGGDLKVTEGDDLQLTIRFKSPAKNNYESPVDSGTSANAAPQVDHVDLIAGDVSEKAEPGTEAYNKDTNDSTKVIATFTSKDWTVDSEGYNVIQYDLKSVDKNQYFRLRGTNLGMNVEGETQDGNPLLDPITNQADDNTRFNAINDRNYHDLWFYSNPVFVTVAPDDEQAVQDTLQALDLGDLSNVTADISLPIIGERGTRIDWTSSEPTIITNDGKWVAQPANNSLVTLTATIMRGEAKRTKTFFALVQGVDPSTVQLRNAMMTADGLPYPNSSWTNQTVTASVYADVYAPSTSAVIELSLDGGENYQPYASHEALEFAQEGEHSLLFRATDDLGNQTVLPLVVKIDKTLPVISLVGSPSMTLTVGDTYREPGAKVTDAVGVPGEVTVTGDVNTSVAGTYVLHYHAADAAGNQAVEVQRTIHVVSQTGGTKPPTGDGSSTGGTIPTAPTPEVTQPLPSAQVDVSAAVGAKGSIPNVVQWVIPQGAVTADGKMNIAVLNEEQAPSTGAQTVLSPIIALTSTSNPTLSKPMTLTLHYDADKLATGQKPAVYYYNAAIHSWIYVGGSLNADGTITVDRKKLETFAVFGYEPIVFADMNGHWAKTSIDRLTGMQAIRGYEDHLFHPNDQVTRAQFASIFAKALGLQASGNALVFNDTDEIPTWAKSDIAALVEAGWISGYKENGQVSFKPDQVITRAEIAVMLNQALHLDSQSAGDATSQFKDVSQIPSWTHASVNSLVQSGIIQGYEDQSFRANSHATRAEAAVMMNKLLDALNR